MYKGRPSTRYGNVGSSRDEYSRGLNSSSAEEQVVGATTRTGSYLTSGERGQGITSQTQNSNETLYASSRQGSFFLPNRSGPHSTSRLNVRSQLPSFRAIVRQLHADAHRRHYSEFSTFIPRDMCARRPSDSQLHSSETIISRGRSVVCDPAAGGQLQVGNNSSAGPINRSTMDVLFRDLARERLKRSVTRLSSNMGHSAYAGQTDGWDTDVGA